MTGGRSRVVVIAALVLLTGAVAALVDYWAERMPTNDVLNRVGVRVVVIALVMDQVLRQQVSRPIGRVISVARRFGQGDLDARVGARPRAPFSDLARSFDAMADQLSDTLRDLHESQTLQHRFVADVSHELRTPLASMVAANEGLDSDDPTTRDRSIGLLREQTLRLAALVNDLLAMSSFDAGQESMELEEVDVAQVAEDALRTVAPESDARVTVLGETTAEVDVRRIHTVLRNLVANAFLHGQPPVDVFVNGRDPHELVITVADDGPGVPVELRAEVFDRFVRADAARTESGAHSGLGLAIALENARLHGATLTLSPTGRTAFELRLPRRRPEAANAH